MKKGNNLLNHISKLNTFIHMTKSNEFLKIYIDKIFNKKCKSLKFISDFDQVSLELLYTSIEVLNANIDLNNYNKIDKKELKFYMDKLKGISYFKKQLSSIKDEKDVVEIIVNSLSNGEYICNNNNTARFDNGLVIDVDWLIDFAHFLIISFNSNENLSLNKDTYTFKTVEIPDEKSDLRSLLKGIKVYEYNVTRKDKNKISFQNLSYLINILSEIKEYDFQKLKEINSILTKEKFSLSINKLNINYNRKDKEKMEKLFQENQFEDLSDFIKENLKCYDSKTNTNRRRLYNSFESLRSLSHAYKCNYTLDECRKLFSLDEDYEKILSSLAISNFYINYIYDEKNLKKYFNFAMLDFNEFKPKIIDYETDEYKNLLSDLSRINKKIILENRKINKYLAIGSKISKNNSFEIDENRKKLGQHCTELDKLIKEVSILREELSDVKDLNRETSNINKTKIKYIKEALARGKYYYDIENKKLIFSTYSSKDYHITFQIETTIEEFNDTILSEKNRNIRINYYQI